MKPSAKFTITVTENGPYVVTGGPPLADQHIVTNAEGESVEYREGKARPSPARYELCRCGQSRNKPYCDGSHEKAAFDGTETASRAPYLEQAQRLDGPTMQLLDAEKLCAFARFCDRAGQVWNLVEQTNTEKARHLVAAEAGYCPGGRLVAIDKKTKRELEPDLPPSIGLVEDTAKSVNGPIWVRGGIPVVAADGTPYEVRNRLALCRCGRSSNKPYCDGSHAA